MIKCLYEELIDKKLDPVKLPLDLAYSVPYDVRVDQLYGTGIITYKEVKVNLN